MSLLRRTFTPRVSIILDTKIRNILQISLRSAPFRPRGAFRCLSTLLTLLQLLIVLADGIAQELLKINVFYLIIIEISEILLFCIANRLQIVRLHRDIASVCDLADLVLHDLVCVAFDEFFTSYTLLRNPDLLELVVVS